MNNNYEKILSNFLYSISFEILIVSIYVFCGSLFNFFINKRFLPDVNKCVEGDFCTGVTYSFFEKISPLLILLVIMIISFVGVKKTPSENKKTISVILGILSIIGYFSILILNN
jgi:hypothetical protein